MKEQILRLAQKYEIDSITKNIKRLNNDLSLKVAFLGEFASGKSTLINALIGRKILPAMQKPTSKSIIEIYSNDGNEDTEYYLKTNEEELREISPLEFSDIALGKSEGIAVLKIKENEYVKKNFALIDTPGISSLDEMDADITFGYLPFIDGAVICHDINKGDLTKSVYDFLLKREVRPLMNNFIFALTHIDTKSDRDNAKIRRKVIDTLKELINKSDLKLSDIQKKVILVSGEKILEKDPNYKLDEFLTIYEMNFVDRNRLLHNEKIKKELKKISEALIELLKDKQINFSLSDEKLNAKISELEADLSKFETDKKNKEKSFAELELTIETGIYQILENNLPLYNTAKQEQFAELSQNLVNEITTFVENKIRRFMFDYQLPNFRGVLTPIELSLITIDKINEISKTVVTAAITASLLGGTSVAANTGEAAGGAGVRTFAKKSAEVTGKAAAKGKFLKFLGGFGKIIKEINPVEHAGDLISDFIKKKKLAGSAKDFSSKISAYLIEYLKDEYYIQYIEPLEEKVISRKVLIEKIIEDRINSEEELTKQYQELKNDISNLENHIREEQHEC